MSDQTVSVPLDAVLKATIEQRNTAYDQVAALRAHVEQLTVERDQVAAQLHAHNLAASSQPEG